MREPEGRRLRHAPADERAHCDAMTVRFEHETRIEAPAKLVFDLSLDIYAHRALMAASKERATAGVTSGPIGLGETVTWRAIHFRIPFTMTSRVTELERPHCFIDEQVRHTQPLAARRTTPPARARRPSGEDATQRRRVGARDVHVCVPTQGRDKDTARFHGVGSAARSLRLRAIGLASARYRANGSHQTTSFVRQMMVVEIGHVPRITRTARPTGPRSLPVMPTAAHSQPCSG